MLDPRWELVLQELSQSEYRTALEISNKLNLSEKTVRIRMKELNDVLKNNGAKIVSKKRFGYKLELLNEKLFISFSEKKPEYLPTTSAERVPYILAYLLNREDYIKIDDICDFLYVSRNTLTADLKKVEYILNMYNLQLERRPNYGIIISGKEFDKRVCMTNSLIKWNNLIIQDNDKHHEICLIADVILKIINNNKLKIAEISFDNLVMHTFIAIRRIKRHCSIHFDLGELDREIGNDMIHVAQEIAEELQNQLGIIYDWNEIVYLAIHLYAKISSDSSGKNGPNIIISGKIDELVLRMITTVYEVFKFDFRNNLELRMNLNQHMVPLDIRIKYGIPLKNPILQQIKKEYALAYTVASGACTVLNEQYGKILPEDEIGYFAMIFALALEKRDKVIDKKNVVIVCVSGKGSSQLFIYKYKQAFGQYINKIFECTIYELENFSFKDNNIDYVFTTIPINIKVPVPVFEVNLFLEHNEIITYREMFEMGSNNFLHNYYKKELFLQALSGKTKEEVILKLCEHAKQYYCLPEDFFHAVMKREELGQTDFGNLIAIPHPYKVISKDNFVAVGILEQPIWWGHNEVQVVFLIALSTEMDADIERFYQLTTNFLFDSKKIELFIRNPDFELLINLLGSK